MKSITDKAFVEIVELEEKVSIDPNTKYSTVNTNPKQIDDVKVKVDNSDEQNIDEDENIFSAFNQSSEASSLKVDVQIDEDALEEKSDTVSEDGKSTVFGQGTNPKPEDETYLNLLKKTTPRPKVKIKVDKD